MHKPNITWKPQAGGQVKALTCPVRECLIWGNRGGGKTDVLLMDYAQGVGRGYGADYRGLLLREATTELKDVIAKSKKWFPRMFPGASFNESKSIWTFPDGETLWFNYARVIGDYDQYHGHEYPWIGWEELTNHAIQDVYLKLMSCNRSSNKDIPRKYRSTCNPSGPGHAWVKLRFIDAVREGRIVQDEYGIPRTHIFVDLDDNKILLDADPDYKNIIRTMTENNEMLRKAWLDASWDLVIGGFFTDVWRPKTHIIRPFKIPHTWNITRSFDWGSSKPWAVSYIAICNGDQPDDYAFNIPKGSAFIVGELYGWTGEPNKGDYALSSVIAEKTLDFDRKLKEYHRHFDPLSNGYSEVKVIPGPADNSIWDVKDGKSIGTSMSQHKLYWSRSYKGSGSRIAGWALIRNMLGAALSKDKEQPHLYFFENAMHHIRTLPLMQRDDGNPDDIDSDMEDHCFVYDTKIITDQGIKKIGDLVGTEGKVLSVNGKFVSFRNCRLVKKDAKVIKVTFSDNHSVICTEDHKFLTNKGFIEGKDLLILSDTQCIVSKINSNHGELTCSKEESRLYQKQNYVVCPIKIEQIYENQDVYCLVAENTHTFALENGVIVSNCLDSMRYGLSKKMVSMKRKGVKT